MPDGISALQDALRQNLGIKTMLSAALEPGSGCLRMSTYSAQEFMTALAPGPVDESDDLARRIVGRPADLGVGDETWGFEAVPTIRDMDSGREIMVLVTIPESDYAEVPRRLGGS
jgi:hypothetical protein